VRVSCRPAAAARRQTRGDKEPIGSSPNRGTHNDEGAERQRLDALGACVASDLGSYLLMAVYDHALRSRRLPGSIPLRPEPRHKPGSAPSQPGKRSERHILGSHTNSSGRQLVRPRSGRLLPLHRFSGFETAKRIRRFCSCVINPSTSWLPTCRATPVPRVGTRQDQQRHALGDVGLAVLKCAPDQVAFSDMSDSVWGNKDSYVHLPLATRSAGQRVRSAGKFGM